mmetsp:Transcript_60659/g.161995  ORF Transcript_60659/g.161995 Transcript_60659/m.161995 type:complete len:263 (+) Transcript_60659:568-1356(+)
MVQFNVGARIHHLRHRLEFWNHDPPDPADQPGGHSRQLRAVRLLPLGPPQHRVRALLPGRAGRQPVRQLVPPVHQQSLEPLRRPRHPLIAAPGHRSGTVCRPQDQPAGWTSDPNPRQDRYLQESYQRPRGRSGPGTQRLLHPPPLRQRRRGARCVRLRRTVPRAVRRLRHRLRYPLLRHGGGALARADSRADGGGQRALVHDGLLLCLHHRHLLDLPPSLLHGAARQLHRRIDTDVHGQEIAGRAGAMPVFQAVFSLSQRCD